MYQKAGKLAEKANAGINRSKYRFFYVGVYV
jgi:hypothetical protein